MFLTIKLLSVSLCGNYITDLLFYLGKKFAKTVFLLFFMMFFRKLYCLTFLFFRIIIDLITLNNLGGSMFTLENVASLLSSDNLENGNYSNNALYDFYNKYRKDLSGENYPIDKNDLTIDKIIQTKLWEDVRFLLLFYFEELADIDFSILVDDINRYFKMQNVDFLERNYTDDEKILIVSKIFEDDKIDTLTKNEALLYRNLAYELFNKDIKEGLIAVGYSSYGGNALFDCNYDLAEKCMLKLFDTVDILPDKGFYANTLGYIYYYGRTSNGNADYDKALKYFSFGASCGIYESIYKLSDMYRLGLGGIKSLALAKDLVFGIYNELYNLFICENFDCNFADVAIRLGNIAMEETYEGIPTYDVALGYFTEAKYALSKRNKFGDGSVKNRLEKSIIEVKEKMHFELLDEMEIQSLDYFLWKNRNRDMIATVSKVANNTYNINVKINKEKNPKSNKLFVCYHDINVCGLFEEINFTANTVCDIKECTFEFNDTSYNEFILNEEAVYKFPHDTVFYITSK